MNFTAIMASNSGGHGGLTTPRVAPGADPQNLRPGASIPENSLTENLKKNARKDDLFVDISQIYLENFHPGDFHKLNLAHSYNKVRKVLRTTVTLVLKNDEIIFSLILSASTNVASTFTKLLFHVKALKQPISCGLTDVDIGRIFDVLRKTPTGRFYACF